MKTYAIGRCKMCSGIVAVSIKYEGDEKEWKEDVLEFVEAGHLVSTVETDSRVLIDGCHAWCSEKQ